LCIVATISLDLNVSYHTYIKSNCSLLIDEINV